MRSLSRAPSRTFITQSFAFCQPAQPARCTTNFPCQKFLGLSSMQESGSQKINLVRKLEKIFFAPDTGTKNILGYQKYFRLPKIFFSGHKDQNFFRLPKLFFTPDIGSRYCFPTVSAKRPSGSGFMGTR